MVSYHGNLWSFLFSAMTESQLNLHRITMSACSICSLGEQLNASLLWCVRPLVVFDVSNAQSGKRVLHKWMSSGWRMLRCFRLATTCYRKTYCYGLSLMERYKARFSNIIHYMSNYHFSGAIYIFNCHHFNYMNLLWK
jgi:hypothetical protein